MSQQKKTVPLAKAENYVGKTVEVKGTPKHVKTLSDGKEGYIIKGPGGKIMCSSSEKLDGKPVVIKGKVKKVYGVVYLDVEKADEKKKAKKGPVPKKTKKPVPRKPEEEKIPPEEPVKREMKAEKPESVRLMVRPGEMGKKAEKKTGFMGRIKGWFGKERKKEKKKPVPKPKTKTGMLPEEKKERMIEELRKRGKKKLPPVPKKEGKERKKGLLEKLKLKRGKKKTKEKPKPKPKGKKKVIVKKPEELEAEKKKLLEKIKKKVPKKAEKPVEVQEEKVEEVEWPPVAVPKGKKEKEKKVKKKTVNVKSKKGKVIKVPPKDLPTKILGSEKVGKKEDVPLELKELEEPTRVVSEVKQIARTPIDRLLANVRKKGEVGIEELATELNLTEDVVKRWARILEEHKLVSIKYPPIGKPKLVSNGIGENEKESKENTE